MMEGQLLTYSLSVPYIVGFIQLLINKKASGKVHAIMSSVALLIPAAASIIAFGLYSTYLSYPLPIVGLGYFMLFIDGLNWPVVAGIALVTVLIAIYSYPYMEARFHELGSEDWGIYYFLYVYFSVSLLGIVLSNNFILFYLFLEVSLITSFLLIALYGYGNRQRISIIYLIWTHLGGFLFLVGSFIYGLTLHTFNFYPPPLPSGFILQALGPLAAVVATLIVLGMFIKMAVFGVHMWLPYAHAEAPTPVSALLSPVMIGIGGYAIIRITYVIFEPLLLKAQMVLLALSVVTIIYGGLMALKENDFKRLLAYSSIAQMGYMLMGIATLSPIGILGALLQFFAHAVGKSILFSSAGVLISKNDNLRDINKMGGLAKSMPYTSSLALLGFMDISGLPPTIGFFSKLLILIAVGVELVKLGLPGMILLAFVLLGFGLTPAYAFYAMKRIFFGPPKIKGIEANKTMLVPMILIAVVGIITFAFPSMIVNSVSGILHTMFVIGGVIV
ncbi:MAG: complex I subunit 5 family protein [Nitrososphaeria archaeon]|nr:complex I subunit 5 family protein [Conexivisphaerales archaeon]